MIELKSKVSRWCASGKGMKASGSMILLFERINGSYVKVSGWSHKTYSATGHSCGLFSDEQSQFETVYKRYEGKTYVFPVELDQFEGIEELLPQDFEHLFMGMRSDKVMYTIKNDMCITQAPALNGTGEIYWIPRVYFKKGAGLTNQK